MITLFFFDHVDIFLKIFKNFKNFKIFGEVKRNRRAGENIFRNGRKFKKFGGGGGKNGRFWPENTL